MKNKLGKEKEKEMGRPRDEGNKKRFTREETMAY